MDLIVTSPPYWALRDYKTDPVVFGGDVDCEHEWGEDTSDKAWAYNVPQTERGDDVYPDEEQEKTKHDICNKCGAWRGQLGLEATPDLFADHLVEIFEECRRVLKPTGNLWVNLGDSYMRKSVFKEPDTYGFQKHRDWAGQFRPQEIPEGYKRKDWSGCRGCLPSVQGERMVSAKRHRVGEVHQWTSLPWWFVHARTRG